MPAPDLIAAGCGVFVGFSLGLIGGGGSILATPMLLYLVGVPPHVAIGTGAFAVSVNAFANFAAHARARTVRWAPGLLFALAGTLGSLLGSTVGKAVDGRHLILAFAFMMIAVGALMLRPARAAKAPEPMGAKVAARVAGVGFGVGLLSGFFGIGGGFLIVPGLMFATGMPMINAVGTSLFAVGTFGLTTALNYSLSGLVAWRVAAEFIAGGVAGGFLGMKAALTLAPRRDTLRRVFAGLVFAVAAYIIRRSLEGG